MTNGTMAPDAEDCEEVEQLNDEDGLPAPAHQARRILPDVVPPVHAWVENEELERLTDSRSNSPGESRRLLYSKTRKQTRLQAGLPLGVEFKKHTKCPEIAKKVKPLVKTKFQKRKEKLIEILKPPYFIITMIIIIVMVHLCCPEELRARLEWSPDAWWREPWRLVTYGFMHASAAHLALNALVAFAVGWRLEREQGWARVAAVWTVGIAAGALGAGALQRKVHVVGASAAVYALLTAHLPNVCLRFGYVPLWWFRPLSVLVLGASEGCWALLQVPEDSVTSSQVAWAAHVLGAAVGIPLGFVVFTGENISKLYIRICRVISVVLLAIGVIAAIVYYMLRYAIDPYT